MEDFCVWNRYVIVWCERLFDSMLAAADTSQAQFGAFVDPHVVFSMFVQDHSGGNDHDGGQDPAVTGKT